MRSEKCDLFSGQSATAGKSRFIAFLLHTNLSEQAAATIQESPNVENRFAWPLSSCLKRLRGLLPGSNGSDYDTQEAAERSQEIDRIIKQDRVNRERATRILLLG